MSNYYRLTFEPEIEKAWYLSKIMYSDNEYIPDFYFISAHRFNLESGRNVKVIQSVEGYPVDFRLTAFGVPVVSKSFADVVQSFDGNAVQRIPVEIDYFQTDYEILNILDAQECIDDKQTYVQRYTAETNSDKVGEIHFLGDIKIVPEAVKGHHIFRLDEWKIIIIVSNALKQALESNHFIGMRFVPV